MVSATRAILAGGFFANDALASRLATTGDFAELSLLGGYAAIAFLYFAGSHGRLAFEARWLRTMMAIDWVAFAAILAASGGFQSTYFPMCVLLILVGMRTVGMTRLPWIGAGIVGVFILSGLVAEWAGREDLGEQEFAIGRIVAVAAYGYLVFALALWRPGARRRGQTGALEGEGSLQDRVLAEAARLFQSDRGLIRWVRGEAQGYRLLRYCAFAESNLLDSHEPWFDGIFLYDFRSRLTIRYEPSGVIFIAPPNECAEAVAKLLDASQIVFIRLECPGFDSALAIASDVPLSEDFAIVALDMHDRLKARILATLAVEAQRADAKAAERAALARNLHDSAIQSLASIRLQLASLKQQARIGRQDDTALGRIAAIEETAAAEMRNLRELVGDLDAKPVSAHEFRTALKRLAASLSNQWQIACTLDPKSRIQEPGVSGHRATDAFLAVREAVSNAVRHGRADRVSVRVKAASGTLTIDIANNGSPVPEGALPVPRSIHGRVSDSGGKVSLRNTPDGVRLSILMPAR